ncbi:hypothetical protein [Henriciella sp.]|nr:hypothetical protein [Henriciella sp.]
MAAKQNEDSREARLKAALRDNLKRRKQAARKEKPDGAAKDSNKTD